MKLIIDRCRSHASVAYNSKQHKKHLAFESIPADCQHGFRSQRSCETQLVQFYHDMVSNPDGARDRGHKQTDAIMIDFAEAFDQVTHRRLLKWCWVVMPSGPVGNGETKSLWRYAGRT